MAEMIVQMVVFWADQSGDRAARVPDRLDGSAMVAGGAVLHRRLAGSRVKVA